MFPAQSLDARLTLAPTASQADSPKGAYTPLLSPIAEPDR